MPEMEATSIRVETAMVSPASTVFIIDCLGEGDKQSGRSRHEGIRDTLIELSPEAFEHDLSRVYHERCSSQNDWMSTMDKILQMCRHGHHPLIFIDGHGDRDKGLRMPSGGFISWKEYEITLIRLILTARGQLTVVAAFCHSYSFVENLINRSSTQLTRLPFAFYYGYKDEVPTFMVEQETRIIYESLLRNGGQSLNSDNLQISHYSEYDHAIKYVAPVIMMQIAPNTLISINPKFSKTHLRRTLEVDLAKSGWRLGQLRQAIKTAINSPLILAERLLQQTMHETERRRKFTASILTAMSMNSIQIHIQPNEADL